MDWDSGISLQDSGISLQDSDQSRCKALKPEELMLQPQGKGKKLGDLEELIEHMKAEGNLLEDSLLLREHAFYIPRAKESL